MMKNKKSASALISDLNANKTNKETFEEK